jgi:DNA polymerase I-like protein with 3'-5' exonuclease and polymerase domains
MSKHRLSARTKKRREADQEVMDKMHDIFQKVKKYEHELTDTILSTPYFKAR